MTGIVIPFPRPLPAPDWAVIDAFIAEMWPEYERELCTAVHSFPPRLRVVR